MPIYGFTCNACGKEFQTLVRASDTPTCPACESPDLSRQLSLIAQPAKGSDAGTTGAASDLPPCASGACCFGGGCG